ncbi:hypothetical protein D4764_22G0005660, partial [Takifugu flavidus]
VQSIVERVILFLLSRVVDRSLDESVCFSLHPRTKSCSLLWRDGHRQTQRCDGGVGGKRQFYSLSQRRTGRAMEKIQKQNKELLRSVTELQHEVRQLKEQLAEKDEQLSRTIKRRQIRTVAHVDALTQLNQARADLTVSQEKCSDLEEKLQKGPNDSHQSPEHGDHVRGQKTETVETSNIELSKKEEALKLQFLEKEQQMEAWMRPRLIRLISMQEEFQQKLLEEREKDQREMSEREERLRQQLERGMREERDDCLKKQLSTLIESWQTEAQKTPNYIEKKEKKKKKKGANSTHLSAPLQLIPDPPVFILSASPVPQNLPASCLRPRTCLLGSSYNLLPRLRLLCLASTRLPLAPHRYLCLAARLWTPPLGRSTKSKPIPFP